MFITARGPTEYKSAPSLLTKAKEKPNLTCSSAVFYPGYSVAPLDSFHRLSRLKIRSKSCVISLPLEFHFTSYGEHYCDTQQDTCEGFPLLFCFMEKFVSCPSNIQMPRIPILMGTMGQESSALDQTKLKKYFLTIGTNKNNYLIHKKIDLFQVSNLKM